MCGWRRWARAAGVSSRGSLVGFECGARCDVRKGFGYVFPPPFVSTGFESHTLCTCPRKPMFSHPQHALSARSFAFMCRGARRRHQSEAPPSQGLPSGGEGARKEGCAEAGAARCALLVRHARLSGEGDTVTLDWQRRVSVYQHDC